MYYWIFKTHVIAVTTFLLLYIIKTVLLLINKEILLDSFRKKTMVFEMVISTIFLITGIYLGFNSPMIHVGNWFWVKLIVVALMIPMGMIAFKKKNKWLAVLTLLAIVYVYGVAETKSATFKKEAVITE